MNRSEALAQLVPATDRPVDLQAVYLRARRRGLRVISAVALAATVLIAGPVIAVTLGTERGDALVVPPVASVPAETTGLVLPPEWGEQNMTRKTYTDADGTTRVVHTYGAVRRAVGASMASVGMAVLTGPEVSSVSPRSGPSLAVWDDLRPEPVQLVRDDRGIGGALVVRWQAAPGVQVLVSGLDLSTEELRPVVRDAVVLPGDLLPDALRDSGNAPPTNLTPAVATNGRTGFVSGADLGDVSFGAPAEALARQELTAGLPPSFIPVYTRDGRTQIGVFRLG